ncbi:hypothetical protein GXN76_10665 [Kroppenstedtia pulmonis]|uniref:Uncharacterized protein n=1 Tax=Kroppenstedtia pulmonis TaxID=1380685 RepID=A0A7D3XJ39_9BACL|nr:hypothetical protein [Kroppenstedtia pulmonis]QKG84884.1 hypothetical protein GXN76_10665 [Kroppenstedtia pulmonis]
MYWYVLVAIWQGNPTFFGTKDVTIHLVIDKGTTRVYSITDNDKDYQYQLFK